MSLVVTILATIIIFSVLVLVHEFGHFWIAKRSGIKVLEFGIGFPPRIFGKKKGDTLYSVNWIPFGGFVRLYGEDSHDARVLKDPQSYASKSPLTRAKVAFGGVFMNFVLAWLLLFVGFVVGMEPLIASLEDLMIYVEDGTLTTAPGVFVQVKETTPGSSAEKLGLLDGDRLFSINGREIFSYDQINVLIEHNGEPFDAVFVGGPERRLELHLTPEETRGLGLYPNVFLPRLTVLEVAPDLSAYGPGLQGGDIILSINDVPIFDYEDYHAALRGSSELQFEIFRGGETLLTPVTFSPQGRVYINGVFPDSAAEKAGFLMGDVLTGVAGAPVANPDMARELIKSHAAEAVEYFVQRGEEEVRIMARPDENGLLGVALSPILPYDVQKLTLAETMVLSSVIDMGTLKFPVHVAAVAAVSEGWKISKLTAVMFADTLRSLVSRFEISESVGGPVRIASLTGTMIQEGTLAVLRFVALLSLSLGVINLFPLPALDGGRLLFILIEVICGKSVNARWEALIHTFGFVFLLLLIFAITYHDIVRLVS